MNNINDINTLSKSLSYLNSTIKNIYELNNEVSIINELIPNSIKTKIDRLDIDITGVKRRIINEKNRRLLMYICTNKFDIISALNNKFITIGDLISISEDYMKTMLKKDNNYIPYWKNLKTISSPYQALLDIGISYDIVKDINKEMLTYLIDNKLMYNSDGMRYAYTFIGLLSMFGFRISSKSMNNFTGFYIGEENSRISGIDNVYEYICKSVGFDSTGYVDIDKYKFAGFDLDKSYYVDGYIDTITPNDEINVGILSTYFKNGKCGDILLKDSLIKLILDNDKEGYYVIEINDRYSCVVINYYKYEDLKEYKITNMVSFYNNVTKNGYVSTTRDSNFIPISEYTSLGIDEVLVCELNTMYNKMNKNPNAFKNPEIDEKHIIDKVGDVTKLNLDKLTNTIKLIPLSEKNILPENKFSHALPKLSYGNVNYMEIGDNSVNYEVVNINNDIYTNYIDLLKTFGYKCVSEGTYLLNDYKVVTELSYDKTKMAISLFFNK